jgi:hypothetical protein
LEFVSSYLTVLVLALVIERKVIKNTGDSLSLCLPLTLKLLQPRCNKGVEAVGWLMRLGPPMMHTTLEQL